MFDVVYRHMFDQLSAIISDLENSLVIMKRSGVLTFSEFKQAIKITKKEMSVMSPEESILTFDYHMFTGGEGNDVEDVPIFFSKVIHFEYDRNIDAIALIYIELYNKYLKYVCWDR